MRRLSRRNLALLTAALVAAYVLVSAFLLLRASAGAMARSVGDLQQAQGQLFTDPSQAAVEFRQSSQAAEASLAGLRRAPWWSRLLAALPPFRWQVGMIKATHALASAGTTTATLVSDFPSFADQPGGDLGQLLSTDSRRYGDWYDGHRPDIALLEEQLGSAQGQLDAIPSWAMVGQRRQVSELRGSVAAAHRTVVQLDQLSGGLERSLQGDWTVIFPDESGTPEALSISGKDGRITGAAFEADSQGTVARYRELSAADPFWNQIAPQLGAGSQGLVVLRQGALQRLLGLTGPVALSGVAGTKVDAASFPQTLPPPSQLVPALVSGLSATAGAPAGIYQASGEAARRQDLQAWSADPGLERLLTDLLPLGQPPAEPNWLLVDCGGARQRLTMQRVVEWWKGDVVQHVGVDSPGSCAAYLPTAARPLGNGAATAGSRFQRIGLSGNSLTYSLPLAAALGRPVVLPAPGAAEQSVELDLRRSFW